MQAYKEHCQSNERMKGERERERERERDFIYDEKINQKGIKLEKEDKLLG